MNFVVGRIHTKSPRDARLFRDPIHNGAEWSWECSLCGAFLRGHATRLEAIQTFETHRKGKLDR